MNYNDCSGFVKAVQCELAIDPFRGNANSIYNELYSRSDWTVIGRGSHAADLAGKAANEGAFVVAAWQNPDSKKSGHIAIITAYFDMLQTKPEQRALGVWGRAGIDDKTHDPKVGQILGQMSKSFGSSKHPQIVYGRYEGVILSVLT